MRVARQSGLQATRCQIVDQNHVFLARDRQGRAIRADGKGIDAVWVLEGRALDDVITSSQNLTCRSQSPAATVLPSSRKATALMGDPWLCCEGSCKFTPSIANKVRFHQKCPRPGSDHQAKRPTLRYAAACVIQMRWRRSARYQTLTTEGRFSIARLADRQ